MVDSTIDERRRITFSLNSGKSWCACMLASTHFDLVASVDKTITECTLV